MRSVDEMLATRALEAVPSGIAVADASSDGLPLVYVNPAFERLSGVAPSRALGGPCARALDGAPGPRALEALHAGETWREGLPRRREKGSPDLIPRGGRRRTDTERPRRAGSPRRRSHSCRI